MLSKYEKITDEDLVFMAKSGDEDAEEFLIRKYKEVVKGKANLYYIVGADKEDLMQEGMIGIFKAIKSYQEDKMASFCTFANICINRQIITAIRTAGRLKHLPLNSSISLNSTILLNNPQEGEGEGTGYDKTLADLLRSGSSSDPEAMLLLKETLRIIEGKDHKILSPLEVRVLAGYMRGKSYSEIGGEIGKAPKSIDNAVQRIRKKLAVYLTV